MEIELFCQKNIYNRKHAMKNPATIEHHISRGFGILEEDPSITDFGVTRHLDDKTPLASIPRGDFDTLSQYANVLETVEGARVIEQREKIIILRAILARGNRKWQFVWNGIKISAPILDDTFYDALARHEYEFGQGDILDVLLEIYQERDEATGVYFNKGYQIRHVFGRVPGYRQGTLFRSEELC